MCVPATFEAGNESQIKRYELLMRYPEDSSTTFRPMADTIYIFVLPTLFVKRKRCFIVLLSSILGIKACTAFSCHVKLRINLLYIQSRILESTHTAV